MSVPPRFNNAATLRSSPARTNIAAEDARSSSLVASKPALASMLFGPSSTVHQYAVEPDLGNNVQQCVVCKSHTTWPVIVWKGLSAPLTHGPRC